MFRVPCFMACDVQYVFERGLRVWGVHIIRPKEQIDEQTHE